MPSPYGTPTAPASLTGDQRTGWNQQMYPLEDADKAMNNALTGAGYNVYAANPFTQSLQRTARGMRQSYIQDRAMRAPATSTDPAEDYGQYLQSNLQGGGIYGRLKWNADNLGGAVQNVRHMQESVAGGGQRIEDVNPYLKLLADELGANNGQGTATALTYLRTPQLGNQLGRSYASQLSDLVESSQRTLASDPAAYTPGGGRDVWSYIFGRAGSPF